MSRTTEGPHAEPADAARERRRLTSFDTVRAPDGVRRGPTDTSAEPLTGAEGGSAVRDPGGDRFPEPGGPAPDGAVVSP
ncbi:hypothetical protein [Streptomyces sp. NPDC057287]|uniref:hypothetical protein n=1 Tax=Streptomyces sp. NPDC057287 TaxID=3346086 RepID=UPI00363EE833